MKKLPYFWELKLPVLLKRFLGVSTTRNRDFFLTVAVTFGNSHLIIINLLQTIQGKSRSIKRLK